MTVKPPRGSDSDLAETAISSESVFEGKLLRVRRDVVRLPNGGTAGREWVVHPGAVMIIPLLPSGDLIMERQFRYPLRRDFIEFPAGKIDPGEDPLVTGRRELLEETGYTASRVKEILEIIPSPGILTEHMWVFVATGLREGAAQPEEDEKITARKFSLAALEKMIRRGTLHDGKSVSAILFYARFLHSK